MRCCPREPLLCWPVVFREARAPTLGAQWPTWETGAPGRPSPAPSTESCVLKGTFRVGLRPWDWSYQV